MKLIRYYTNIKQKQDEDSILSYYNILVIKQNNCELDVHTSKEE